MRAAYNILVITLLMIASVSVASAQYYPERRLVREGNTQFDYLNFRNALNRYNEALEHDTTKYESLYNRANGYLQTMLQHPTDTTLTREVSNSYYEQIAADKLLSKEQRAEVLRNLGESLFVQQNYEAALNAFRESLKLNPADRETKYNYILTKRIVDQKRKQQQDNQDQQQNQNNQNNQNQDQQQNQDQNNEGDNNDQNQDQNQNENQDQNDNGDQPKDNENEGDQNEDENDNGNNPEGEDEDEGEAPPPPSGISREEQERMLDAIQAQEDKTNEKLKEGEKALIIPGKKNW